jgi:hypothetical protein
MVNIFCNKNATVNDQNPTTNYANICISKCKADTDPACQGIEVKRVLYEFDISTIPSASSIQKAEIVMPYSSADSSDLRCIRNTAQFTEATVTWNTQPADTVTNQVDFPMFPGDAQNPRIVDITLQVKDARTVGVWFGCKIRHVTEYPVTPPCQSAQTWNNNYAIYLIITYLYDVYIHSTTGNDSNAGDSCVAGHPVLTFAKAYSLLASGGTIHCCDDSNFSGETVTLNKSFSIDRNGSDGYFHMPQAN